MKSRFLAWLCALAAATPALAAIQLYGVTSDLLYTVDPLTGVGNVVAPLSTVPSGLFGGLELVGNDLYGLSGSSSNSLYKIDPTNGAVTLVGALGVGTIFEGGLAWDGRDLWAVNQGSASNCNLVKVNIATGAGTLVGKIGTGTKDFNGLAWHNGQLYGIDRPTNALWLIDTANPANSVQVGSGFGSAISVGTSGGMADQYCYALGSQSFFSVDFSTGNATVLASSAISYRGLAIPEPASLLLLVLAAGCTRRR